MADKKLEPTMNDILLREFEKKLDAVSPTFCLAKWLQVTMHLHIGYTHSCHHPSPHKIPLDELKENPLALHNTRRKKYDRKALFRGKEIDDCHYCNIVDREKDISDRVMKSYSTWAQNHFDEVINNKWNYDILPSYVEVSFGSQCNFKCAYCSPPTSSRWAAEARKFDGYPTSSETNSWKAYKDREPIKGPNPYIDAFWKIFPDMYERLEQFRITGGEPLINKNTFYILDYIREHPNKKLFVSINSNLGVPDQTMDKFIEKTKQIVDKVYKFKVFTSGEGYKERLDYSRFGINYDKWIANIRRVLDEIPESGVTVTATYNILCVTSFREFLDEMLQLKLEYKERFLVDIPVLITPEFLSPNILTEDFLTYIEECADFMYNNLEGPKNPYLGFYGFEAGKMKRIYDLVDSAIKNPPDEDNLITLRKDFYLFFQEYDRRRGTNFLQTYPEMQKFWNRCKKLTERD